MPTLRGMEEDLEPIIRHRILAHVNKVVDMIDKVMPTPERVSARGIPEVADDLNIGMGLLADASKILKNLAPRTVNISTIGLNDLPDGEYAGHGERVAAIVVPRSERAYRLLTEYMPPLVDTVVDDTTKLGPPGENDFDLILIEEGVPDAAREIAKSYYLAPGGKILTLARIDIPG